METHLITGCAGFISKHLIQKLIKEKIKIIGIDNFLLGNKENIDFAVLTTKSAEFTYQLLKNLNLQPKMLYGHESGTKQNVLLQLSKDQRIKGFIEDRRDTLEAVLNTPGLGSIPCYLAGWGYLRPNDKMLMPSGIYLLETKNLMLPLANWH